MQGQTPNQRKSKGSKRIADLIAPRIRQASEKRGFAQIKVLTHWDELVGPDIAQMGKPIEVKFGRDSFAGAKLVILTTGAYAPLLKAQEPVILTRINACYGYKAISKLHITQTAPTGFSEGQIAFETRPQSKPVPSPIAKSQAQSLAEGIEDEGLKASLAKLGAQIYSKAAQGNDPASQKEQG